jgi:alpha-glucosidase
MTSVGGSLAAPRWWQGAVFYQIYPRSFADGNGDGVGDFAGMIERLDYLSSLGVDAVWLSPHYPSPLRDVGYDIADYVGVHPEYGTLDDFLTFLNGAHERGIRVVLDLVLNHTSNEHPWFAESRATRDGPKRDWYLWRDGRAGGPPNNWVSQFGGPAWTLDERTGQYYYHSFLSDQPDLNWRLFEVRDAMWRAIRFWLELGVDGFRLDAIGNLFKAAELTDHGSSASIADLRRAWVTTTSDRERAALTQELAELFRYQVDLPEVHDLMRELRTLVDAYPGRVLIGETDQVAFYGSGTDELDLVFNFPLMRTDHITPSWVRRNQDARWAVMPPGTWPANTLGNHDESRVRSRFGRDGDDIATSRLCAGLVLTLPGTPFLYNGEEIGMTDLLLDDVGSFRDNWAVWFHRAAIDELGMTQADALALSARFGRDKNRTPMQWANSANAGFSSGEKPWLPVHPNHSSGVNVADQERDRQSLLRFYRRLLRIRRRTPALRHGDCTMLHEESDEYLAFLRSSALDRQTCLVVLNMSAHARGLRFDLPTDGLYTLFSSEPRSHAIDEPLDLRIGPYEIYVAELE